MERFSLKGKEEAFELESKDGIVRQMKLVELDGKSRDAYLTSVADKMRFDDKGNPAGLKSFDGLQASLLMRTMKNEKGELVSQKEIQEFPASVLNALYEKAQKMNALNEEGVSEVKKD